MIGGSESVSSLYAGYEVRDYCMEVLDIMI